MDPEPAHGLSGRDAVYETLQEEKERLLSSKKAVPHLLLLLQFSLVWSMCLNIPGNKSGIL